MITCFDHMLNLNLINTILHQNKSGMAKFGDTFDNPDVQRILERTGEDNNLLKCKICGVKFDNPSAFEGHVAAGHLSINNPTEERPSGLGHLAKDPFICEVCGRSFGNSEQFNTHRLQH
jgi:hypothetical protein